MHEPICFQDAAASPIDLRPFEEEKQEVSSAEVLAATFTVLAVLPELEITSFGGAGWGWGEAKSVFTRRSV